MENKVISRTLKVMGQLMELHDQNPFKIRSLMNASFKVDKLPYQLSKKSLSEIASIDGFGKSIAAKIEELILTARIEEMQELISLTPPGVIDILGVKGLGPKKVQVIWKELGIETIGELFYACNENRLIEAKGFGLKTQEEVKRAIEFKMAGTGKFLYAHIESFAVAMEAQLKSAFPNVPVSVTGQFRRCCEVIDSLDVLIGDRRLSAEEISRATSLVLTGRDDDTIHMLAANNLIVNIILTDSAAFYRQLFTTTGSESHLQMFSGHVNVQVGSFGSEQEIYAAAGLSYIEPELREGLNEIELAASGSMPKLIEFSDLKGCLHNHSTWSDGVHSLEEMALFCRDEMSLSYLGISDHSKTATYAKGLSEERVLAQQAEIDELNTRLAPFRIFKGIESDILSDGSLDYTDEILASFDFVVASIHSAFKMDQERATARLVKAVENPYTTILGHPSGRLLLSRMGYPVDFKRVIDACAANGVVIEINANPLRLDMDWRWHRYALEKGVMLSINPDAHRTHGFYDMHFGVLAARKGSVSADYCLNAMDLKQLEMFLEKKRYSFANI